MKMAFALCLDRVLVVAVVAVERIRHTAARALVLV